MKHIIVIESKSRKWIFRFLSMFLIVIFSTGTTFSQLSPEPEDPENYTDIPAFYKSKLSDIDEELHNIRKGSYRAVAISPGGLPVYAVYYGEKEDFHSQANYNSAVGARNPVYYAKKNSNNKPVVFFLGPVHGQESEGIVGLVNLIHIIETGKDYRGQDWISLQKKLEQCRVIIIPCGNPDGRKRCPYDSFVGFHNDVQTKYGQGTRKDGSLWRWPWAKSLHPMKGDVGILGAYFNDDGINMMHDDFFAPMAAETKAILDIARVEAPDMVVSLHSHKTPPRINPVAYQPWYMKERVLELTRKLNSRYREANLPHCPENHLTDIVPEDIVSPARTSFNLNSALHHVSGAMSFTFECCHGTVWDENPESFANYTDILDIQLMLYDEMLDYVLEKRLYWE